jgi:hypothetical protein
VIREDGIKTLKRLRLLLSSVRAVVFSGYFNSPVLARPEKYGFMGVIPRPCTIKDLVQVLSRSFST